MEALLLTAIFTGLRASELCGLRWADIDLEKRVLRVHQRADRFAAIGRPKSTAGEREVPIPPIVVNTLREWKLACPKRDTGKLDAKASPVKVLELAFPNLKGLPQAHQPIVRDGFMAAQIRFGIAVEGKELGRDGKPVPVAKFSGLHALRHFYASWCINRREDGGLALPAKVVQERLGHSTIAMTMATYSHLFPRGDDAEELAAAESALLG